MRLTAASESYIHSEKISVKAIKLLASLLWTKPFKGIKVWLLAPAVYFEGQVINSHEVPWNSKQYVP